MKNSFKNTLVFLTLVFVSVNSFGWGLTGHRVVAEIAQRHLNAKAATAVKDLLGGHTLPDVANWADEIRSDSSFSAVAPFHYVSIDADYSGYLDAPKNPGGDVVVAINTLSDFLMTGNASALGKYPPLSQLNKEQALKLLVHFVGDIHQPLHEGGTADQGGNLVKVHFMNAKNETNLHAVWDSDMIDATKLSYTEYATMIDHASPADIKAWENSTAIDWANEGLPLRAQLYIYPDKQPAAVAGEKNLPLISYAYIYKNHATMEKRLLQGGIRLAHLVNLLF